MRRLNMALVSLLFIGLLAAPSLSMLLPVETVELENRPLRPPEITAGSLLDPDLYREMIRYVSEANPMRRLLIRTGVGVDYSVFGDSPDPSRVLVGEDGWLYFRDTMEDKCDVRPAEVAQNLEAFIGELTNDVPTVVWTVAPSKFVIHPEHLTEEQWLFARCAFEKSAELERHLRRSPTGQYVDSWELLRTLAAKGRRPYLRTDTHFHFEGSIPWMKAIVDQIAPVWDERDVVDRGETLFLGNLMQFMGLDSPERVRHLVVDREVVTEMEEHDPFRRSYRTTGERLIRGRALMAGDSFLDLPEPSMVQFFANVRVADLRDEGAVDWFLLQSHDADVVFLEISELFVWDLFSDRSLAARFPKAESARTSHIS